MTREIRSVVCQAFRPVGLLAVLHTGLGCVGTVDGGAGRPGADPASPAAGAVAGPGTVGDNRATATGPVGNTGSGGS
jgi:hypothetical protein